MSFTARPPHHQSRAWEGDGWTRTRWGPGPTLLSPIPQLMQQQAALVAAHSAYLSPMATMAAVQMQHMAAINANGLIATPITPSSGKAYVRQVGLGTRSWAGKRSIVAGNRGATGSKRRSGSENGLLAPLCPRVCRLALCICAPVPLLCRCRFSPPRNQHPACHCRHARLCHPCCLGRQRLQPGAHPAHGAACP